MGIEDIKNFYEEDKRLYEVLNNEEFKKIFYEEELDKTYSLEEMQQVIDFICCWYEDKYTERDLEYIEKYGVPDVKSMIKNLADRTVDNLFEVLPDKIAYFLLVDKSRTRINLLNLVILKILYSKKTTPERGFERAKIFISEFNRCVAEINLNTKEIEDSLPFNFERIKIVDEMVLEEFVELPIKEAERLVKAKYSKVFKGNNSLNSNYNSKGKVKTFTKRLFRNKK